MITIAMSSTCLLQLSIVLTSVLSTLSSGYFNLYMCVEEVQKLLGLNGELYYVRNGIVNNYALNFVITVPATIEALNFNWEYTGDRTLTYTVTVNSSNEAMLATQFLNISNTGLVPQRVEGFSIGLHCIGMKYAEIDITIVINTTIENQNSTELQIRRRKICSAEAKLKMQHVNAILLNTDSSSIFYYAMGCACVLATTSVMCIIIVYMRNHKYQRNFEERNNYQQYNATFLSSSIGNTSQTVYRNFCMISNSYTKIEERYSKCLQERISELTIQRCRVCLRSIILEGTFGRIYCGTYTGEESSEEVFIKTVNDHASQAQISLLLQEGMTMYSLNHRNILTILGVSFEDNSAPFLLYPYRSCSNLKLFLQKCKLCSEGAAYTLTTQDLVEMALQIVDAINYLHKTNILHKDLATRNCLVDDKLKVYVADNALARDLFPADYHCLGDNENRPIKWLALESLISKTFSIYSDVWSFGVLLWELTTLAQQPYVEIDPFEMCVYLKDGYRLAQPINCPDELFAVMAYCWAMNAEERPTFTQLEICLKDFHSQLTRYV